MAEWALGLQNTSGGERDVMTDSVHEPLGRRRDILKWLSRGFLSLWGVGIVWVVSSFIKGPETARSAGLNFFSAGQASALARGEAKLVRHGSKPVYVLRLQNDEIIALSALCTHFSCVLKWNVRSEALECPCHDGVFSPTGEVISGLPRRPLESYKVEVRQGEIRVHF